MSVQKHVPAVFKLVLKRVLLFGVVIFGVFFVCWAPRTQAFKLATTHQPERFTELFFVDPTSLPAVITAGKKYGGSFAVVNHEGAPTTYRYQVTVTDAGQTAYQTVHAVTIGDGHKITVPFGFEAQKPLQEVRIVITLLDQQQSVHFKAKS